MEFTGAQIAHIVNGKLEGNADVSVNSFGRIEEAGLGQLTFLANPKYEEFLYSTQASIVIVNNSYELKQPVKPTLIRVTDAYSAFAQLLTKYQEMTTQQLKGIQQPAYISETAQIDEQVYVGAFSYLGENVRIGRNTKIFPNCFLGDNVCVGERCVIHPGVKIYQDCVVGNGVVIHAGTVLGSDGFGFAPQPDGSFRKVPQLGNVVVENDVEIGANVTIDRATIGSTLIRSGAKLDNLIQVAHNVEIGNNTVIAAQVGISGSTKIGRYVMIGGQAGLAGHIQIADGSKINGQSGVSKSIKQSNTAVTGSPASDYTQSLRSQAIFRQLPQLEKRVQMLEQLIEKMKKEYQNSLENL